MASAAASPPIAEPIYPSFVSKASNPAARVVTVQFVLNEPTVTVAVDVVLIEPLDVRRARNVWPEAIAPDVVQAPPLTLICAVGSPVTLTD